MPSSVPKSTAQYEHPSPMRIQGFLFLITPFSKGNGRPSTRGKYVQAPTIIREPNTCQVTLLSHSLANKSFISPSSGFYLFYINSKPAALSSPSLDHGTSVKLTQCSLTRGSPHSGSVFIHQLLAPPTARPRSPKGGQPRQELPSWKERHLRIFPSQTTISSPEDQSWFQEANYQSSPAHTKLSGTGSYRHTPTAYRPPHRSACAAF